LTHVKKALDAARAAGDPSLMSWALNRAGSTYEQLAAPADAERFLLQALEIARSIQGSEEMFSALNNLCSNLIASADRLDAADAQAALERAIGYGTDALVLARQSGNAHRQAICHGNLGVALMRLGEHASALEHVQTSQQLAQAHGYRSMTLSAVADRAELLGRMGQLDAAIALYEESLAAAHGTDDRALRLSLHNGLYKGYKAQGDAVRALAHHEAMLPIERERMQQRADTQARLLLHRLELEQVRAEAERARLDAEVQRLRAIQLEVENRQLAVKATELGRHALEDQLTGLANRRHIDHELPLQMALAREHESVLSVAVIDLDHFKHVNDRYGHTVGDDVLRAVARILLDKTRGSDVLARMGGEEFLVVFSGTPLHVAVEICERLRQAIESHDWSHVAAGLALTISIGVCDMPRDLDVRGLLDRADAALYAAKREGRNRVQVAMS
jgi:diguanylate cyclase (GGDEF)-like protein